MREERESCREEREKEKERENMVYIGINQDLKERGSGCKYRKVVLGNGRGYFWNEGNF